MNQPDNIRNQNWFQINYASQAPVGLPPIFQAECVKRYRDETGSWIVALWEHPADPSRPGIAMSNCILRLPDDQVDSVTQHRNLNEAAAQMRLMSKT